MNKLFSITRNKNGVIIWSEDQIEYIKNDYILNHSTTKIAKEFTTSPQSIRKILRENNIKIFSLSEINQLGYPRNSNFFSIINTPEKAYWLGFFICRWLY